MIAEISINWAEVGTFIQSVGVPFACLLIFAGPFIYLLFNLLREYGPQICKAHVEFVQSTTKIQTQNSEILARLESKVSDCVSLHDDTISSIRTIAKAGSKIIEGDKEAARKELQGVEIALEKQ